MKKHLMKKRVVLSALVVVALAVTASVAYAYFTAGGSGTGTATAAAAPSSVTVVQTNTVTAMWPGGTAQTLTGNFNNPNANPVYVTSVTAAITSVTKAGGAPSGTCDATDFTLGGSAPVAAEIPTGNGKGAWTGLTLAMVDKASKQDACQGATVNLTYTAS